jgi:hypothetical protein
MGTDVMSGTLFFFPHLVALRLALPPCEAAGLAFELKLESSVFFLDLLL